MNNMDAQIRQIRRWYEENGSAMLTDAQRAQLSRMNRGTPDGNGVGEALLVYALYAAAWIAFMALWM